MAVLVAAIALGVYLGLNPDSWKDGPSLTRILGRFAWVYVTGASIALAAYAAQLVRGPLRVDSVGILNPWSWRRELRHIRWEDIRTITPRRNPKGQIMAVTVLTVTGRSTRLVLSDLSDTNLAATHILAAWESMSP